MSLYRPSSYDIDTLCIICVYIYNEKNYASMIYIIYIIYIYIY